ARLYIELRILFPLHLLQRACCVDRLVPASLFTADLLVGLFHTVDAESYGDVEIRAFIEDTRDVREDPRMDLAVRHQVNRIKLVVLVKRPDDLRQVLTRKRFAAGKDQNAKIAAKRFGDTGDLVG